MFNWIFLYISQAIILINGIFSQQIDEKVINKNINSWVSSDFYVDWNSSTSLLENNFLEEYSTNLVRDYLNFQLDHGLGLFVVHFIELICLSWRKAFIVFSPWQEELSSWKMESSPPDRMRKVSNFNVGLDTNCWGPCSYLTHNFHIWMGIVYFRQPSLFH